MCQWRWEVFPSEEGYEEDELVHVPFYGGVRIDRIAMEEAWCKLQPFLVSWTRRHPDQTVRAVVSSCNGPRLTRWLDGRPDRVEAGW